MAYSTDLRERIVAFIKEGGKKSHASRLFKVSRPTIDGWIQLKNETGSLEDPPPPPRSWRKLTPDGLLEYVKEHPDDILEEYAEHFNVSAVGVWRALKRLKITRKKRLSYTKKGTRKSAQSFWGQLRRFPLRTLYTLMRAALMHAFIALGAGLLVAKK